MSFLLSSLAVKASEETYYVYFSDGRVWGYPKEHVKELSNNGWEYVLVLDNDSLVSWPVKEVNTITEKAPEYPMFTTFKLDDKLNDQLYRDVEAVVSVDGVTASVSGIGKYLTPLFGMDNPEAVAYVGGMEQISGQSRLRFADEVVYTLSLPGYERLLAEEVHDDLWGQPEGSVVEIPLTEDMLSTNAPTSFVDEGLGMMLDGNTSTIFHSTWSADPVYSVDLSKQVYVAVDLPYAISALKFYYMGRSQSGYNIEEWQVEASHDGEQWVYVATIDESMGVPTEGASVSYTSDVINLGGEYAHVRFVAVRSQYKNYLCLSELRLYEVVVEDNSEQSAQYTYRMVPMGREVPVRIDWLTDHATSVPRIDIDIDGGEIVKSKDYYLNAVISFRGNGVWDDYDFQDSVKIKGRGNTSWSTPGTYYNPKNPYRLKFAESVKPFGMKKGKNWNLISQAQSGSLMTNPVAHKIARMVGLKTANDVVPVELYMNGEYRGSYIFTQKVGMANNSVDFDDESMAALFELDSYREAGQFDSYSYDLPVNIKAPEFGEDETQLDYYGTVDEFNRFETSVFNNANYERFVDMDMLVRYMLVNDLVLNTELGHPKSAFLSRENMGHMASRYTFGPAWDFDWAYGYEGVSSYCTDGATRDIFSYFDEPGSYFFNDLLRSSSWVQYRYSKLWQEFIDKHLDELIDFVDDYYAYAGSSFEHNYEIWSDGSSYRYLTRISDMKEWLYERAHYLHGSLTTYEAEPFAYGDLDGDAAITSADMEYMQSALFGAPEADWISHQADADADGEVTLSDLTWLSLLLGDEQASRARSLQRRAAEACSDGEIDEDVAPLYDYDIEDLPTLTPQGCTASRAPLLAAPVCDSVSLDIYMSSGEYNVSVGLTNPTPYIACSMDFVLPAVFTLHDGSESITLTPRTESSFSASGRWVSDGVYRVIAYSTDNTAIVGSEGPIFNLSLSAVSPLSQGTYAVDVENVTLVTENASEDYLLGARAILDITSAQIPHAETFSSSQHPHLPADVYDLHGRLVRKSASSLDGLSRGVYIINQKKTVQQ